MPQPPRFEVVGEQPAPGNVNTQAQQQAAFSAIMLALKTLSQRTLIALAALRTLLMVGSVFWLAMSLPHPDTYQLSLLGIYSAFVLAVCWFSRIRGT